MKCSDCKGSGEYSGLNLKPEPCQCCNGLGVVGDETPSQALEDMTDANPPEWKKDYLDKVDLVEKLVNKLDEDPDSGWSKEVQLTPELKIGDTLYIYNAGWFETKITHLDYNNGTVRADAPCKSFRIKKNRLTYNLTQGRWEYIRGGVPVWP